MVTEKKVDIRIYFITAIATIMMGIEIFPDFLLSYTSQKLSFNVIELMLRAWSIGLPIIIIGILIIFGYDYLKERMREESAEKKEKAVK